MDTILGLSFSDSGVQAAVIEQDGPSNTLLAIDEWNNTLPFRTETNGAGISQFVENLYAFIRVNRVRTRKVAIALDSSQVFINTIPIEEGISRLERNDHMQWELGQYFPEAQPREFATDVHVLTENRAEQWTKVLSVSARREMAHLIQKALARLDLNLHVVDVDHFSADTALRTNYPDSERKYLALVGIKENRLDISLVRNGTLESYSYCTVSSDSEIIEQIGMLSRENQGLRSMTAYGTYLNPELLVQIRRGSSLLIEALNPLRHVRVSTSLRLADHLTIPSYRFASAIGVALRRD